MSLEILIFFLFFKWPYWHCHKTFFFLQITLLTLSQSCFFLQIINPYWHCHKTFFTTNGHNDTCHKAVFFTSNDDTVTKLFFSSNNPIDTITNLFFSPSNNSIDTHKTVFYITLLTLLQSCFYYKWPYWHNHKAGFFLQIILLTLSQSCFFLQITLVTLWQSCFFSSYNPIDTVTKKKFFK